ncbi:hypothetical protein GCM10025873_09140 [Demequina sediminis]|nr:hypothetical protein GCM10025873_09140 [Demequina sediminis]
MTAWAMWDWATQPFNSVIITFVFTALYLTSESFIDPEIAALGEDHPAYELALSSLAGGLGTGLTVAGILVALLAPVLGQRADTSGKRKAWLGERRRCWWRAWWGCSSWRPRPRSSRSAWGSSRWAACSPRSPA